MCIKTVYISSCELLTSYEMNYQCKYLQHFCLMYSYCMLSRSSSANQLNCIIYITEFVIVCKYIRHTLSNRLQTSTKNCWALAPKQQEKFNNFCCTFATYSTVCDVFSIVAGSPTQAESILPVLEEPAVKRERTTNSEKL